MKETSSAASLRNRQADLTRDLIMDALASLVAEKGAQEFSIQAVADRAGVSHRTVYRHYPSREALLEALADWLDENMAERGGTMMLEQTKELPEAAAHNFAIFDALRPMAEAYIMLSMGTGIRTASHQARTRSLFELFRKDATGHLSSRDAKAVGALLRLVTSSVAWYQLREDYGVDAKRSARVVSWAAKLILAELERGGGPQ